jgi:ZIP family zinc transporter
MGTIRYATLRAMGTRNEKVRSEPSTTFFRVTGRDPWSHKPQRDHFMSNLGASAAWGVVVAASLVAGAVAAAFLRLPERVAATLAAFGGGILFAAVALELVPEADEGAGVAGTAAGLLFGAVVYVSADAWLTRDKSSRMVRRSGHAAAAGMPMALPDNHAEVARGESIAAGLVVDGIPESVALGLTIAEGKIGVALLAGILVGNLVEAYGAAHPIIAGGHSRNFAVGLHAAIGAVLALATVLGGTLLADAQPSIVGGAQAVAAGAVLAVVSVSIIPYAFSEVSSRVAIATAIGFIVGYLLS